VWTAAYPFAVQRLDISLKSYEMFVVIVHVLPDKWPTVEGREVGLLYAIQLVVAIDVDAS